MDGRGRRAGRHLTTAGLRGGKGSPDQVATRPRVFATLTPPGFGPAHNRRPRPAETHGGRSAAACGIPGRSAPGGGSATAQPGSVPGGRPRRPGPRVRWCG
ncbi:replication initiator [Streptomyces sp. MUM 2J]|uniref:replication initiator n=1 Tax=unclassified Streptomyces TaxID=2593676 RepID=UPI0035ABA890